MLKFVRKIKIKIIAVYSTTQIKIIKVHNDTLVGAIYHFNVFIIIKKNIAYDI